MHTGKAVGAVFFDVAAVAAMVAMASSPTAAGCSLVQCSLQVSASELKLECTAINVAQLWLHVLL